MLNSSVYWIETICQKHQDRNIILDRTLDILESRPLAAKHNVVYYTHFKDKISFQTIC